MEPRKDRLYWVFSSTGVYTVKSGYRLAKSKKMRESQERHRAESSVGRGSHKGEGEISNGWSLPQKGWIKINSDAALQQNEGLAGWRMVARDWKGNVLGAWAIPNSSCSNPKLEESMALRAAMVKAKQQGWRRVMFESDCLMVVEEINREQTNVIGSVVLSDIRKLRTKFDECCCTFTRRVNNSVSHTLAKMALKLREQTEWKDVFPGWLLELGQADVAGRCPSFM
ncbi:uncharacterized protein LOC113774674 [Coffea eugenioides]|uniref:uncharacterized protein LOC113774674 n=1 Tax=Coffea eugenioides TaxID=49369 RepID=UPI000F60F718|nr:uncharacterized protein LOC113774674 [Coffea eugenioides]